MIDGNLTLIIVRPINYIPAGVVILLSGSKVICL